LRPVLPLLLLRTWWLVTCEPIGEKFRREIRDWAHASGVPEIRFRAGGRKADVMAPYLQAAAEAGRSQVVAVGCAQEHQSVWTARRRQTDPGMCPLCDNMDRGRPENAGLLFRRGQRSGRPPGQIACDQHPAAGN
jgi:hypothetical protein